jgi:cytochrome b
MSLLVFFIIGLLSFRVAWGFVGSTTARFSQFVRGKAAVTDYLNGRWQGVGHNPLGGWSVLLMLTLLFAMGHL